MKLVDALKKFEELYGEGEERIFFSPGRINLIGEHLDYNGGHVLPAAIDKGIYFVVRKRDDKEINLCSVNMEDKLPHHFADYKQINCDKASWLIYPKSVMDFISDKGISLEQGFDLLLWGNLPNSAGVSSSAALLVGMLYMLNSLYDLNFSQLDYALYAQKVENDYVGLHCGIMDQFAIAFGKANNAIFLNTDNLEYQYINADLDEYQIVVFDSNKKRELRISEYNNRKADCEKALSTIKEKFQIDALAECTLEQFEQIEFETADIAKRAKYVIEEEARVVKSCAYLQNGDLLAFAEEMKNSHIGLRDLYEVTGKELDTLFELALKYGAIGTRMTGAGFGGCTISLVKSSKVIPFIDNVLEEYEEIIGHIAKAFVVSIGDGTKEVLH